MKGSTQVVIGFIVALGTFVCVVEFIRHDRSILWVTAIAASLVGRMLLSPMYERFDANRAKDASLKVEKYRLFG
jgi:hypothetical protein